MVRRERGWQRCDHHSLPTQRVVQRVNPFPSPEICMAAHLAVATARRP